MVCVSFRRLSFSRSGFGSGRSGRRICALRTRADDVSPVGPRAHPVDGLLRYELLSGSDFPSASECAEGRDGALGDGRPGCDEVVLAFDQVDLPLGCPKEIRGALPVLDERQFEPPPACRDTLDEERSLLLAAEEARQPGLD